MDEQELLEALEEGVPEQGEVPDTLIEEIREAAARHPRSVGLLLLLGRMILRGGEGTRFEPAQALEAFEAASWADPDDPEVWEEIGWFHDSILDDPWAARPFLEKAVDLGGGVYSFVGLARVLAELGEAGKALALLHPGCCPCSDDEEVEEVREEIESGVWDLEEEEEGDVP